MNTGTDWDPVYFLMGVAIYFIPWIVAVCRDHHNDTAIFMTNLLLGWTVLGWIIALIWACTEPRPSRE